MNKKYLFFFLFNILLLSPLYGQKPLKNIKRFLKDNQPENALKKIEESKKDSDISNTAKLYHYGVEANKMIYKKYNMNIYLKRKIDTAKCWNNLANIYTYAIDCDSVETLKGKYKYRKSNRRLVHSLYKNLSVSGRWFWRKKNFTEVVNKMNIAVKTPLLPLWGNDTAMVNSSLYTSNMMLLINSAYLCRKYDIVKRHEKYLLDHITKENLGMLQLLSETHAQTNDTMRFLQTLQIGLSKDPQNIYFYTKLNDFYNKHSVYNQSLKLADYMLRIDSTNAIVLSGKSMALMNLGRDAAAANYAKKAVASDSTLADPYYFVGASYCNLATKIVLPASIRDESYLTLQRLKRSFYQKAMPYLEHYRRLRPADKSKWIPLLYQVYMELNEGAKFDEINRLLN